MDKPPGFNHSEAVELRGPVVRTGASGRRGVHDAHESRLWQGEMVRKSSQVYRPCRPSSGSALVLLIWPKAEETKNYITRRRMRAGTVCLSNDVVGDQT